MTQNGVRSSKLWASILNEYIKNCIHEVAKFTDVCMVGHRGRNQEPIMMGSCRNLFLTIKTSVKFRRRMEHEFF